MTRIKTALAILIIFAVLQVAFVSSAQETKPLRESAEACEFGIGAAVNHEPLRFEKKYAEVLSREFNMIVAENVMKMVTLQPTPGRFDFTEADALVAFAEKHGMKMRGHTLVWHESLPTWLTEGKFTRDELMKIMETHIKTVMTHFKGKIFAWDVLNEAITEEGQLRDTIWLRGIGEEYMDLAFKWAREADPDAKLFYNDFNAEGMNAKSEGVYKLVKGLKDRGAPIDGIGLQTHLKLETPLSMDELRENMDRLAELGLEIQITELDMRTKNATGSPEEKLIAQAELYNNTLIACLEQPACTAVLFWGFTDRYTWLNPPGQREEAPLLFDRTYKSKPVYEAFQQTLELCPTIRAKS